MPAPTLTGKQIRLRSPVATDVDQRLALGQPAEVMLMFGIDPKEIPPLTLQSAEAFIERLGAHQHAWVIEHDGKFLGEIRLDDLNLHDKRAKLAVGLYDPTKFGRGLGRESIRLVLDYAFDILELHRVYLRVVSYNERAIRSYRACGFVEEGREREAAFVSGTWHDDLIMGLLTSER